MKTLVALLLLVAVGVAVVLYIQQVEQDGTGSVRVESTPELEFDARPVPAPGSGLAESVAQPRYGDRILQCEAPDGSTVYTNAVDCESVDHSQRVSVIAAPKRAAPRPSAPPPRQTVRPSRSTPPPPRCGRQSLQLFVPNPQDVRQQCKWAWGRAQELERMLSQADDPGESIWLDEYCERVQEVVASACDFDAKAFCYEQYCLGRRR